MQNKAHLYAARYRAQEQQREIKQQREATRRAEAARTIIGIIALLILLSAIVAAWQWRKTQQRNRILAEQITEAVEYKGKYSELKRSIEAKASGEEDAPQPQTDNSQLQTANCKLPTPNCKLQTANYSDADLFDYLRNLIEEEQLFLSPNFERQTLINRTGLSKERIGAAFAHASGYERLTTLVRELRLNHAVRLFNEQPDLNIEQVSQASGFSNTVSFNRSFKAKFGMTPSEFRGTIARNE